MQRLNRTISSNDGVQLDASFSVKLESERGIDRFHAVQQQSRLDGGHLNALGFCEAFHDFRRSGLLRRSRDFRSADDANWTAFWPTDNINAVIGRIAALLRRRRDGSTVLQRRVAHEAVARLGSYCRGAAIADRFVVMAKAKRRRLHKNSHGNAFPLSKKREQQQRTDEQTLQENGQQDCAAANRASAGLQDGVTFNQTIVERKRGDGRHTGIGSHNTPPNVSPRVVGFVTPAFRGCYQKAGATLAGI